MFELDGVWVSSATDLVTALRCEYQLLQRRAEKAGVVPKLEVPADELMARAADLGIDHENAVLDQLVTKYGEGAPGGVVKIAQPKTVRAELEAAHAETLAALQGDAEVVFQAAFFDGHFHGLSDFVVRTPGDDGIVRYEPADTKFARHARVEALLQLASYGYQLEGMGLPAPQQVHLWLGDGTVSSHRYADLRPILLDRSGRMRELLDRPPGAPEWGDPELRQCGRCDYCKDAIRSRRDVLLVAGLRVDQRKQLAEVGITTVEELAAATPADAPESMKESVFVKLHAQARLQAAQDATVNEHPPDGKVSAEVADAAGILLMPPPNPGDVFFDFEGDPLHLEPGGTELGLEYLFGTITHGADREPHYDAIWAHDRLQERVALEQFIDWLMARRLQPGFGGLHVYHYAAYEVTALKRLVQRYGTRADELDVLLKDGVFVDLYGVVRRSIRCSQRSYSIKKLEPLYMGTDLRKSEVTGGAESIVWYAEYQTLMEKGDLPAAAARLEALRSYNEYDCLSTLRLRDWLLAMAGAEVDSGSDAAEVVPAEVAEPSEAARLARQMRAPLIDIPPAMRTPQQQATAMLAAAVEYHRREVLPFWWDHFRRVGALVDDWEHDGEMIVLDPAEITVIADWHKPKSKFERTFEAVVDLPGSFKLSPGEHGMFAIHEAPIPSHATIPVGADRGVAKTATFDAIAPAGERYRVTITESLPTKVTELEAAHHRFPVALSVDNSLEGKPMAAAIFQLATTAHGPDNTFEDQPAMDLLQRRPPRLLSGGALPPVGDDVATAITAALLDLDHSYLAVQGPPGTGKSTTGAKVIAELISRGWKIGIVAQSHRTVEGLLDKVVRAGVDPSRVLKKEKGSGPHLGTVASDAELLAAATDEPTDDGWLIGGTSWDFVNNNRVPAGSLDLLVVDEAGQFSLADTIAVSRAAPRLLLLGDPQQLPQVSQALHPEPVDQAALGWLTAGHDTLPPHLGYFLERTYRMRPELTSVVSRLSYDGRLESDAITSERSLDGIAPGLRTILVDHQGNRAASNEEADEVIRLATDLIGRNWTDPFDRNQPGTRPLGPLDVIVVAPFNAQVNRIRERLDRAGLTEVAVGTVDKFQGREAAVVIVSLAASSADSSSRGAGFLLSRHRLNVAISRAQHAAFLLHAPQLTDFVPATPAGVERLGAFLGVSQAGRG